MDDDDSVRHERLYLNYVPDAFDDPSLKEELTARMQKANDSEEVDDNGEEVDDSGDDYAEEQEDEATLATAADHVTTYAGSFQDPTKAAARFKSVPPAGLPVGAAK